MNKEKARLNRENQKLRELIVAVERELAGMDCVKPDTILINIAQNLERARRIHWLSDAENNDRTP